ncbi:MAG: flagellar basal-body rod protein FlgG [Deltaproteobacteria bacterium]|nr:flagellar basal-body rod protein FlgG [Deltaproteobacteria bacterium]MBW1928501.1 flagellar basal-body rod protein FlgG [Deltaproteobacteria bacterium]RLB19822.1 MAG: flagellar basal-body rod protein FlgG [Deltaproteobacteria bacterium]
MIRSLWTAASGMAAQKLNIDVIANNLANVNTSGFKKSRADFEDLLYQNLRSPGAATASGGQIPTGIQVGMGTRPVSVQKVFSQGDYVQTNNEFDLAIEGKGFFKVISNGEEVYMRSGNFKIDSEGYICTPDGDRLQPEFSIPSDAVHFTVDSGGNMVATGADGTELASAQLTLYSFPNPSGLLSIGGNRFLPTEASGDPVAGNPGVDGMGTIAQGYLEMSNVDVVEEMVNMITSQRAYEVSSKCIKAADEMLQLANNIRR